MASAPLQPALFLLLSALFFLAIPVPPLSVQAQTSTSCANSLVPCASYLNSTTPPDSCCTPLKNAITNDLQCLCAIYEDPTILKAFNINLTQASQLAGYCGINSNINQCSNASAPSGSLSPPPPSKGAGARPVWIGVSGLVGLFSIFWSICA